mgnify:CR=1 FL=1
MKHQVSLISLILVSFCICLLSTQISFADACEKCHQKNSPGIYLQWKNSNHGENDISCIDCHGAEEGDIDAFKHNGKLIATIVSPKDCSQCHEKEAEQVGHSHHAKAGQILQSLDAYLAHVAGGDPVAIAGCENCHGTRVEVDDNSPNKLSWKNWPNGGIGRINPDGSLGSCGACHTRHSFDRAQARQPETCGKCHLGPDHPQKEIYEESKHGNIYFSNIDKMNLDSEEWVVGKDYYTAPTCATCHMSATSKQEVTHDVGERISWTLRPAVSKLQENWETKRSNMQDVCTACHSQPFINGHYTQYDGLVNLYNEKFAKPAGKVMKILKANKSLENPANFSNKVEWTYWEIWHHEGRRARHGAAMMGPDYTWWHGIYEVAQHFYFKFIPEVRETGDKEAIAFLEDLLKNDPMHDWLSKPTAELKADIKSGKIQEVYQHLFKTDLSK